MNPKTAPVEKPRQDELFRNRLENHIDLNHELVILANQINWSRFERDFADMFCEDRGEPALSIRLIVGLFYLKYTFHLSDEELAKRWLENPYRQYFCG
ncbi:MAG: transposase, partial [Planctomycetaceae bacterium]|nr:transposase [Planctomycetaceae bacterium]